MNWNVQDLDLSWSAITTLLAPTVWPAHWLCHPITNSRLTLCFCCRLSTAHKSLVEMPALQIRCFSTSQDSSSSWSWRNCKKLRASSSRTRPALLLSNRLQHKSSKTSKTDRYKVILKASNLHFEQLPHTYYWYVLLKLSNQRRCGDCIGSV